MTRKEHMAWAKERALRELDAPGITVGAAIANALASLASDLRKHDETADHLGLVLGIRLIGGGHLRTLAEMREHIEGYN